MSDVEIVREIEDLLALPDSVHWFCPRDAAVDEHATFYDEDCMDYAETETLEEKKTRQEHVRLAGNRKRQFQDACQILAYDGDQALELQDRVKHKLNTQLTRCTICIREYHRGRHDLKHGLEEQYGGDVVDDFMARFDQMNIGRIATALDSATETLMDMEPAERSIGALPQEEMYALFEAMHCTPLLADDDLLQAHFDKPFHLVQTRKKVTMSEYVPAMVSFLFSKNPERSAWALRGWKKFKRPILAAEFDWAVRDILTAAATNIKAYGASVDTVSLFWRGVRTIVEKLTKEVITHHLRAMDVDINMLILDHLQADFPCYPDLVTTMRILLETSPNDFWGALGAIPPQTVAEQAFNSPFFEREMLSATNEEPQQLEILLCWIDPFIESIKATNLAPACRAIVNQFMSRAKMDRCTGFARSTCWQRGVKTMVKTLEIMDENITGSAVVTDLLEIVRIHVGPVLEDIQGHAEDKQSPSPTRKLGLDLVRCALSLDCHSLARTRADILQGNNLGHDLNISSLAIWKAATRAVHPGDIGLASAILIGVKRLLILEPLTPKQSAASAKQAEAWNSGFSRATTYISDLLEHLQDFESVDLAELLKSMDPAQGFFAVVFSGHVELQQAANTIIKAISSAETRRDGIRCLLEAHFNVSLSAISHTLQTIAEARSFAPCRTVLKLGIDLLDGLCSPQDGILRSKTLHSEEVVVTESAWQSLWTVVNNIFKFTEDWSMSGQDKNMMVDFCRDTMDFADQAFDQYSVITGALHDACGGEKGENAMQDIQRHLLEMPREASGRATRWLRLRDEYLIAKAVMLTCRIMGRLRDVDLQLPEEATFFVDDIVSNTVRSKLTIGQKAELKRALDTHIGNEAESSETSESEPQRPQKQSSLSSWIGSAQPAGTVSAVQEKSKRGIDMDAWRSAAQVRKDEKGRYDDLKKTISGASPTVEMLKLRGDFAVNKPLASKKASQAPPISPSDFRRKRQEELEAQKRRNLAIAAATRKNLGEAGSGLNGIGIEGKDPSARGEGVMVSSDESSDDEDGGFDAELFGVSKPVKRGNAVLRDASGAIGLKREQRGPVKLQRQIRSAKDMRARLAPDLSPLHKIILSWDFFHDGEYPPNTNDWQYRKVSNSFRHVGDYQDVFRPLLTLEAWTMFAKSREENTNKPFDIKIVSRSSVDAFIEIGSSITHADNREMMVSESDVILFSTAQNPTASRDAPHCLARVYRIRRQKQHLEITYRVMPNANMVSHLKPGNTLYGTKIQSITPLEREYGALLGLQYYDLCDEIIKARPSPLLNYTEKQLQPIIDNYTVNKAQARAIRSAVDNDAFSLIQGPPGSGKTKTIVAIVGALLTDRLSEKQGTTRIQIPKPANANDSTPTAPKKLLVCAPSNAAVDELVMRFKAGLKTLKGVHKEVNVVRLGRSDAINSNVVDVTMDELVKKRLGQNNGDKDVREKTGLIMKEHQAVCEQFRANVKKIESPEIKGDKEARSKIQEELDILKRRRTQLSNQIDNAKDAEASATRTAELNRRRVQQAILDEAHVICATLSGSGHDMFQSLNIEFETVVVDEAAQCVEMSALIPLKYGCAKCILVGDPRQLPPTVFSKIASKNKLEQSLFVRMQENFPDSVHLLDTQYRMHPDISSFPSATFYEGRLLDGEDMAGLRQRPWHSSDLLAPYRFFDVQGQHKTAPGGHSLVNHAEVEVAMSLYERLTKDYSDFDFKNKIGIITPYKSQLGLLKRQFADRYGESILDVVDFNTTDAFQGRESEVIIFSCVRASPAGSVGFLSDIRRMNVGITRAKSSLWILGNSESLARGEYWKKLLVDAKERDSIIANDVIGKLKKHSSKFPAKARPKSKKISPPSLDKIKPIKSEPLPTLDSNQVTVKAENHDASIVKAENHDTSIVKAENHNTPIVKADPHADAMEGVKMKLEDKVVGMRANSSSLYTPPTTALRESVDIDMQEAGTGGEDGALTPQATNKVDGTEKSSSETPDERKKSTAAGVSNPKAIPGKAPPPIIRKRKPQGPFMPAPNRKQQKKA